MSIGGKCVIPPGLADLLDMHGADIMARLRVCLPGTIWSYDATKRTAQVVPGYNRVYNDGTVKPMPLLVDCPVFTLQGGGAHVGMPIKSGDECLVVFADVNIDAWFQEGGQQTPYDARRHDLSDGFAIVGINSIKNPLTTLLGSTEAGVATATAKVAVDTASGKATMQAAGQSLLTILTNLLTPLQSALAAMGSDPGLQAATKTAANAAATAVSTAITNLGAMLQ